MKKEENKVADFFEKRQPNKKEKISQVKIVSEIVEKSNNQGGDDLGVIKGVGPVTLKIFKENGIETFFDLANVDVGHLKELVGKKVSHSVDSWVEIAKSKVVSKKGPSVVVDKIKKDNKKKDIKNKIGGNPLRKSGKKRKKVSLKSASIKRTGDGLLTKLINLLLISEFFVVGIFFTGQTFQGVNFEKSIFFCGTVIMAAILSSIKFLLKRDIKIRKTPFDKILMVFVLIYIISMLFSVDRWHSLVGFFSDPSRGFIFVGVSIVAFYLILSNFTIQMAKKALCGVIVTITLISIYTLMSGLGLIPSNVQIFIPFSLVGSLRGLTAVLSVGIPVIVAAFLIVESWKYHKMAKLIQVILGGVLLVIMIDLMMLRGFVAWTALAGGLVVLMILLLSKQGKDVGKYFSRVVIFTILTTFILLAGWAKSDYHSLIPVSPKVGLPTEIKMELPVTLGIIKNSLNSTWKQVLIGSGPATFGYDFAKFSPRGTISPSSGVQYLYQGEGFLAEIIPTLGVSGGLLIILLGIILIIKGFAALKINGAEKIYFIGLFISVGILLANGISGQMSGGMLILSILIIVLTVFFMLDNLEDEKRYYSIDLKRITIIRFVSALLVVMFLVGLLSSGIYVSRAYLADVYFKKALKEQDIENRIFQITRAVKLMPEEGVYYTKLGEVSLGLIDIEQKKEEVDEEKIKELKNSVVKYVEIGARLMPNDVKTQNFLATVYEMTGANNEETIKDLYKKIIKLDPNNIQSYIKLGDIYLVDSKNQNKEENLARALVWYGKALNIQPRAGVIYDRIATAYYQKGDLEGAIRNVTKAIEMDPSNLSYKFTLGVLYQLRGGEGDVVTAEKIFKLLLTTAPRNIDTLAQLGLLYEQTGHIDEAKKQYEQAIEIIGDNSNLQKISKAFENFINNLNNGKLNIKKSTTTKVIDEGIEKEVSESNDGGEKKDIAEEVSVDIESVDKEMIVITVGDEGPINVRSEGSLSGEKLTKIKETGEFEKIGENDKWVQIIIPAHDGQEEIKAWVHNKFVTK